MSMRMILLPFWLLVEVNVRALTVLFSPLSTAYWAVRDGWWRLDAPPPIPRHTKWTKWNDPRIMATVYDCGFRFFDVTAVRAKVGDLNEDGLHYKYHRAQYKWRRRFRLYA